MTFDLESAKGRIIAQIERTLEICQNGELNEDKRRELSECISYTQYVLDNYDVGIKFRKVVQHLLDKLEPYAKA